ncbi:hypothetical protein JL720_1879 [Aureococcus anophagefferens]|nr:hypothetical protein JL720_1879 [Aureococcus anophagefferens]
MAEIEGLVRALREGDDAAKSVAALALDSLACGNVANKVAIAEAGGIAPLVELLRDGSAWAKQLAVQVLWSLAYVENNTVLIAEAGAIPPLVELFRNGPGNAKPTAAWALRNLAYTNDANAVAIAAAVGLEALVQLARGGDVNERWLVRNAGIAAKRKAALVVAALLGDCVPDSVPREIKAIIGPYL